MSGENLAEGTLAVLRAIQESGEITTRSLQAREFEADAKNAVDSLKRCGYIEMAGHTTSGAAVYRITYSGERRLRATDGSGVIPGPRCHISSDTYKGEREITTRPGAMDAYHRPSRRGEQYVPHARPISLASRVQDTKFR